MLEKLPLKLLCPFYSPQGKQQTDKEDNKKNENPGENNYLLHMPHFILLLLPKLSITSRITRSEPNPKNCDYV